MTAKSDAIIREDITKLQKDVKNIIRNYKQLNNAEYVINTNQTEFNKVLNKYITKLEIINKFFSGEPVNKVALNTTKEFYKNLKMFSESKSFSIDIEERKLLLKELDKEFTKQFEYERNNYIKTVKKEYANQINTIRENIALSQIKNKKLLHIATNSISIPEGSYTGQLDRMVLLKSNGKLVPKQMLNTIWGEIQKQNGQYDTIMYGYMQGTPKNYPLLSYTNGKAVTMSQEVATETEKINASLHKIYTGRFSSHASKDSCILHEGEIVFMTEASRVAYKKKFPNDKNANWKTINEIKNDKTHMLVFNCRHVVTTYPIQFMSEKKRLNFNKANEFDNKKVKEADKGDG